MKLLNNRSFLFVVCCHFNFFAYLATALKLFRIVQENKLYFDISFKPLLIITSLINPFETAFLLAKIRKKYIVSCY